MLVSFFEGQTVEPSVDRRVLRLSSSLTAFGSIIFVLRVFLHCDVSFFMTSLIIYSIVTVPVVSTFTVEINRRTTERGLTLHAGLLCGPPAVLASNTMIWCHNAPITGL